MVSDRHNGGRIGHQADVPLQIEERRERILSHCILSFCAQLQVETVNETVLPVSVLEPCLAAEINRDTS